MSKDLNLQSIADLTPDPECPLITRKSCRYILNAQRGQTEAEELGLAVLDAIPQQIAVIDFKGKLISVNQAWVRFSIENSKIPETPNPSTGVGVNYLECCESPDALPVREGIRQVLDKKSQAYHLEYPCDSPDKKRWFAMSVIPIKLTETSLGAVVVHADISIRKAAEQKLKESQEQLIQAAKMATIGELSAGVVHEINNPLSIIILTLPQLEGLREKGDQFSIKISRLTRATERIDKIVQSLKRFSRKQDVGELMPISLEQTVTECISLTELKAKLNLVAIQTDLLKDLQVMGDEGEIEQVIVNLVNNAIDAVALYDEKWVKLRTFEVGDEIALQVCDSGTGISPEIERNLFKAFYTTKPAGQGTGLGLSIVSRILEHHGASIRLNRDSPNTCFEIRFPRLIPALSALPKKT